jgi:hypothetical protein
MRNLPFLRTGVAEKGVRGVVKKLSYTLHPILTPKAGSIPIVVG